MTFPKHLSAEAKRHGAALVADYGEIANDEAGRRILITALEAWDRAQACRAAIDRDGMTIPDRWGQLKPHPLLATERDSRAAYLAGLKALALDLEPLARQGA